jgi:predicted secreted Zn-dependent protease
MFIYCIEDINDLKYVGKTIQKLNDRLTGHRHTKKNEGDCSSKKLNLEYCIIYQLEECEEDLSKERERYWINKLNSVNDHKLNGENINLRRVRDKERYSKNKDYYNNHNKTYYQKHKEILKAKRRERYKLNNEYTKKT